MKKNKMMRIASFLLVAVLLSTSVISGTFAKYVTSDSVEDSARVAKFGVVVTASGSLFDKTYFAADTNTPGGDTWDENLDGDPKDLTTLTVESTANVVAPGTKNDNGMTIVVTGTPEVDVKVDVVVSNFVDVYLKGTNLPDMTTGTAGDKFDVAAPGGYYPVKYTLKQTKTVNGEAQESTLVNGGTIKEVASALEGLSARYDANTDLAAAVGTLTLTWAWDYGEFDGVSNNDKADTLLGDIVATAGYDTSVTLDGVTLTAGTDYSVNTSAKIAVTVTQID